MWNIEKTIQLWDFHDILCHVLTLVVELFPFKIFYVNIKSTTKMERANLLKMTKGEKKMRMKGSNNVV